MGMSDLLIRGSARLMHIHPLVGSVSYFGLGLIQSSPDRPAVAEPGGGSEAPAGHRALRDRCRPGAERSRRAGLTAATSGVPLFV